ncbi:MAG TPA: TIM barrel protein [Jatrophihabitans sp.]|jgi:hydroxypyruvate isomerase
MTNQRQRYLANCSLLFTELALLERPAAAKAAGFDAIEFWWPFDRPVPGDAEVDAFTRSITDAGTQLVGLNFFAGDVGGADCGVLSIPARSAEFLDNVAVAVGIGAQLRVQAFNALYGNRVEGVSPREQDELATQNLVFAARAASQIDATVLIEAVSGPKPYPLRTAADSVAVLERVRAAGRDNIGVLCDVFHLASNGDDVARVIKEHASVIRHVQLADAPGRGEPGSGALNIDRYLASLDDSGYQGWIALEYRPTTAATADSLSWLPVERRGVNRENTPST